MTTQPALRPVPDAVSRFHGARMSEEEFLGLPEEKPYLEYVSGVVLQKPMPNASHRAIVGELTLLLGLHVRQFGGAFGPEGRVFLAASGSYRLPDTAYWAPGRPSGDDSVPTLVVEVRSPGQAMAELRAKCRAFREAGADACWIVDPVSRTAELFDASRDGATVGVDGVLETSAVPGLTIALARLLEGVADA